MIQQNTPEWLEMRKSKVGASDAPIILGVSPWKTPFQLWEEKLGLSAPPQMNNAMRRGHELEPIARQAYIDHTGNYVEPSVEFHQEHKWMMASLDGVTPDKSIAVEIKCPGKVDHALAAQGEIPQKYFAQLQHQLAVLNLNNLHYFSYKDGEYHLIDVPRDEKYIKKMIEKEQKFWDCLQNFDPPALIEKDFFVREDKEWSTLALEWNNNNQILKEAKEKEKILRESLIQLSKNKNTRGCGIRVQKIIRNGAIDYGSIPEIQGVHLEKYRKPSTVSWRFDSEK